MHHLLKNMFFYFIKEKKAIVVSLKQIIKIATPLIGSRLTNAFSGFLGMLMVAQMGHKTLAASALAGTATSTVMVIVCSLFFAIAVLVGRSFGANKLENIGGIIRESLFLATLFAIPTTFIIWNLSPILIMLGQEKTLVFEAQGYFHAYALSVLPNLWGLVFFQFAVGISKTRLVTIWGVLCGLFLIIPAYLLIFGKFGFPKLGLTGLGYASSIMYWLVAIIMLIQLGFGKNFKQYRLFHFNNLMKFTHLRELLSFGFFTASQISAEFIAFSISTIMIGWFGEDALAAQQIILQITAFLIMIPYGISQTSGVLIGQAFGRKDLNYIRHIGFAAITLGGIFGILAGLFFCFFPKFIISFYLNPNLVTNFKTVQMATMLLIIGAISQLFDILRAIASGSLRGIYDNRVSMVVSVFISCLGALPLGYALAYYCHLGVYGIRLGFVVSFLAGAIILIRRFRRLSDPQYLTTDVTGLLH